MGGIPAHWRTSSDDADRNPDFVNVWLNEFDAISPWTVGRYTTLDDVDRFSEENIKGDLQLIRQRNDDFDLGKAITRKVDYLPVVWPGGSVRISFPIPNTSWQRISQRNFRRDIISQKVVGLGMLSHDREAISSGDSYTTSAVKMCAPYMVRCGTSESFFISYPTECNINTLQI